MNGVASVETFIVFHEKWQDALILLHETISVLGLNESIKWGTPVYTLDNKNVVGLGAFKHHVAIWFYQGVFLSDPNKLLIKTSDDSTRALRQMRFKSALEIDRNIVTAYVSEAVENHKAGKILKPSKIIEFTIPTELATAFKQDKNIELAFTKLSLPKQRDFAIYIASAKREETRLKRLDNCLDLIFAGLGIYDKYK